MQNWKFKLVWFSILSFTLIILLPYKPDTSRKLKPYYTVKDIDYTIVVVPTKPTLNFQYLCRVMRNAAGGISPDMQSETLMLIYDSLGTEEGEKMLYDCAFKSPEFKSINYDFVGRNSFMDTYEMFYHRYNNESIELRNQYLDTFDKKDYKMNVDISFVLWSCRSISKYCLLITDTAIPLNPNYMGQIDTFVKSLTSHGFRYPRFFVVDFSPKSKRPKGSVKDLCTDEVDVNGMLFSSQDAHFDAFIDFVFRNFELKPLNLLVRDFMINNKIKVINAFPISSQNIAWIPHTLRVELFLFVCVMTYGFLQRLHLKTSNKYQR